MQTDTLTLELTPEELQALKFWLSVIQFQGTREQVRKPLEVYDAVVGKIEKQIDSCPTNDMVPAVARKPQNEQPFKKQTPQVN
ncbi:MAG: hypothetical protein IT331_07405 [Anaerolineae bacterium]|nr:hypothetical protein [Anaerolineae bacterium]